MRVCSSCGAENADGARFCLSCGSSLIPACPVCGAERPAAARFCPSCGSILGDETPAPVGQERRLVTILFADVMGSTGLGEHLDPERLQEVLATYFQAMREEIEAEGGTVEKFIGDAVMAAFGVPAAHEDDPARALRYLELGFSNVGDGDSEVHVRLLLARAFTPYAFGSRRVITDDECDEAAADGERAADMALRLGRPDLASASLDGAGTSWWVRGLYGPSLPNIRRRLELADLLEDPWELGDMFDVAAWASAMIGDYREAVRMTERSAAATAGQAPGMELHGLSWRAFAEFSLGNWSVVVDEILPRVRALLGDRKEDPPYFTAHAFGSAALVLTARGASDGTELLALLRQQAESAEAGEWPTLSLIWLAWILTRHGSRQEVEELLDRLRSSHTELRRPLQDQVVAVALAEHGRWSEVPGFLARSREFAERAGLRALPVHLDRLEGRAALHQGDVDAAVATLERTRRGFVRIGATWERAVTELDLAHALLSEGRVDDARSVLSAAAPDLERSGARNEIERMGQLRMGMPDPAA